MFFLCFHLGKIKKMAKIQFPFKILPESKIRFRELEALANFNSDNAFFDFLFSENGIQNYTIEFILNPSTEPAEIIRQEVEYWKDAYKNLSGIDENVTNSKDENFIEKPNTVLEQTISELNDEINRLKEAQEQKDLALRDLVKLAKSLPKPSKGDIRKDFITHYPFLEALWTQNKN